MAVIVLAMAFLMNILTESLIKRAVADSVREQITDLHRVDRWIARLSMPQPHEDLLARLAEETPDSEALAELAARGGMSAEDIEALRPKAREAPDRPGILRGTWTTAAARAGGPDESAASSTACRTTAPGSSFASNLADMKLAAVPDGAGGVPGLSAGMAG